MRVGYAKLGRSIQLPERLWGTAGDHEAPQLLRRLANATPDVTWVLIGKSRGWEQWDPPANVENPWVELPALLMTEEDEGPPEVFVPRAQELITAIVEQLRPAWQTLDAIVFWVGQHGTTHIPVPLLKPEPGRHLSKPYLFAVNYGGYLNAIMNLWQHERDGAGPCVALCADPRNYLKARDLKWPPNEPILAQYEFERKQLHYRYGDTRRPTDERTRWIDAGEGCWEVTSRYAYGGVELASLPDDWTTWGKRSFADRHPLGLASTAFWMTKPERRRSWYVKNYVLRADAGAELFVKPDAKSAVELEGCTLYDNTPDEFQNVLARWRCTVSLPAPDKNGWVVAKPWQCFAANTVCFHLGPTDAQGWILPARSRTAPAQEVAPGWWSVRDDWTDENLWLAEWLRVKDLDDFTHKVQAVSNDPQLWGYLIEQQRNLLTRRWGELERNVLTRLGLLAGRTISNPG